MSGGQKLNPKLQKDRQLVQADANRVSPQIAQRVYGIQQETWGQISQLVFIKAATPSMLKALT